MQKDLLKLSNCTKSLLKGLVSLKIIPQWPYVYHLLGGPYSAQSGLSLCIERHLISHGCPMPLFSLAAEEQLQAAQLYSHKAHLTEPFHRWTRACPPMLSRESGQWAWFCAQTESIPEVSARRQLHSPFSPMT